MYKSVSVVRIGGVRASLWVGNIGGVNELFLSIYFCQHIKCVTCVRINRWSN